jgi:uncharacterized protein (DUF924 family)
MNIKNNEPCRCATCAAIHQEFIARFGRWPDMTHAEALTLQRRREENEASWRRLNH